MIEAFDEDTQRHRQLALFPAEREAYGVQVRLEAMELHRPRQWGACWLACHLYEHHGLDRFWQVPRVSLDGESRVTLKLYTLKPSKSDNGSRVRTEGVGDERIFLHGMLAYDYFSIVKALRDQDAVRWAKPVFGSRSSSQSRWWCLGEVRSGRVERSKNGASDWTRCPGAFGSQAWKGYPKPTDTDASRPTICSGSDEGN